MIHKIYPYVDYNWWLKRMGTQRNEPTNQNSIKIPIVVKPMNRKRYYKTLGNSVIMSPPSLVFNYMKFNKSGHY